MRVMVVFRSQRKPLVADLLRETDKAYELRYTDRDGKYRFVRVAKSEVREVQPLLDL